MSYTNGMILDEFFLPNGDIVQTIYENGKEATYVTTVSGEEFSEEAYFGTWDKSPQ